MKLVIVISTLILLAACSRHIDKMPKPDNLISKDKMVVLITEMSKLESHIQITYQRVDRFHKVMTASGDSLLDAHDVSPDQFDASMKYYGSKQDVMISIYDEALDELNRELGELEK